MQHVPQTHEHVHTWNLGLILLVPAKILSSSGQSHCWSQKGREENRARSLKNRYYACTNETQHLPHQDCVFLTRHTYWLCGPGENVFERMMVLPLTNCVWGGFAALLSFGRTTVEDCARLSVFVSLSTWKTECSMAASLPSDQGCLTASCDTSPLPVAEASHSNPGIL